MIGLNVWLFGQMRYSLFPVQDTGLLMGVMWGDQSLSFQAMKEKLEQLQQIVRDDPAVAHVAGVTGGNNSGFAYISLTPYTRRQISADAVVTRLRAKLAEVAGAGLWLIPVSDVRTGGRQSDGTYQYTLLSDDAAELYRWAPRLTAALTKSDVLLDANSDLYQRGLEAEVTIDRPTATRLGLTLNAIDNTLYDAYGQRQVSTIYNPLNQYHVVMEVAPRYWQHPSTLRDLWISNSGGNPTGTQLTNASAADYAARPRPRAPPRASRPTRRALATNALAAAAILAPRGSASRPRWRR